jgi:DNA invertase Pin-like site-specific DNA recombinase
MRVCIYSRVSTSRQDTENQTLSLTEWAKGRDWEVVKIYEEYESAWKAGHQAELDQLKADATQRRFDIVLVWALDRLSREGALAILSLVSRLKQYGIKIISYQEPWTEAPGEIAEILYSIAGWVARMESQRRSERTKAGLAKAVASGRKLGRPKGSTDKRKRRKRSHKLVSILNTVH